MHTSTGRKDFKDWVCSGQSLLPYDEWRKNTNLYKVWGSYVRDGDPRWITCGGDVDVFVRCIYDWLANNLDSFLDAVWDSAFSHKGWRDINVVPEIDSTTVANNANNPGYFRGACFREVVVCGGDGDIRLNIKDSITATLGGKVRKTFFMPALWPAIHSGKVTSNLVLTFNKSCKLVSIFSPNIYRYLLRRMAGHGKGHHSSVLFGTASWGVPVIAARGCGYSSVSIVDVQGSVLDACHKIDSEYTGTGSSLFMVDKPELYTYETQSELMHHVLPGKYDHIISCPPYFDLEMYGASNLQSTDLYKTYSDWLEGYWRQTLGASKSVLAPGGVFAFVMGHNVRYKHMADDMCALAQASGFQLVDTVKILPKRKTPKLYLSPESKFEVCKYYTLPSEI